MDCVCVSVRSVERARRTHVTDVVNRETRSRMMSGIRGKNTRPELALRKALHARGFRYRLHGQHVMGHPDLVLPRYRAVIFVHGCFWHRHDGCRYATTPATRPAFWQAKFDANIRRDLTVRETLANDGWRLAIVWECALRRPERVSATADLLAAWLRVGTPTFEIGESSVPDGITGAVGNVPAASPVNGPKLG